MKYLRVTECFGYGNVVGPLGTIESHLRIVVINLKPATLHACFGFSHDELLGNSNEEYEKLDLIKIRVLNVNTMEREGEKGFEGV